MKLSKNGLLAASGSKERQAERKRAMDKQLQLPSAAQPAGISSFFIYFFVKSARLLHVGHTCRAVSHTYTHTHTLQHTGNVFPLRSGTVLLLRAKSR